jgi:hypothetical protein
MWLGGNDLAVEGVWVLETSKQPMNYTNWGNYSGFAEFSSFQPDNIGDEDCLQVKSKISRLKDFDSQYFNCLANFQLQLINNSYLQ